ncbi:MAG TPA: hypothetical protein VHW00_02550 [Thermoanaerobaculia bacterium]|nr:hypothetical protein [Thermoanaerobaculia bacterium]
MLIVPCVLGLRHVLNEVDDVAERQEQGLNVYLARSGIRSKNGSPLVLTRIRQSPRIQELWLQRPSICLDGSHGGHRRQTDQRSTRGELTFRQRGIVNRIIEVVDRACRRVRLPWVDVIFSGSAIPHQSIESQAIEARCRRYTDSLDEVDARQCFGGGRFCDPIVNRNRVREPAVAAEKNNDADRQ